MHLPHHRHRRRHEVSYHVLGALGLRPHHLLEVRVRASLVHETAAVVPHDLAGGPGCLKELADLAELVVAHLRLAVELPLVVERGADATARGVGAHLGVDEPVLGDVFDADVVERGELLGELGDRSDAREAAGVSRLELAVDQAREGVGHLLRQLLHALFLFVHGFSSFGADGYRDRAERERCFDARVPAHAVVGPLAEPVGHGEQREDWPAVVVRAEVLAPRCRHGDEARLDAAQLHRVEGLVDALSDPAGQGLPRLEANAVDALGLPAIDEVDRDASELVAHVDAPPEREHEAPWLVEVVERVPHPAVSLRARPEMVGRRHHVTARTRSRRAGSHRRGAERRAGRGSRARSPASRARRPWSGGR